MCPSGATCLPAVCCYNEWLGIRIMCPSGATFYQQSVVTMS
jgi:hypothetical protein